MIMVKIDSPQSLLSSPRNKFGIAEPPEVPGKTEIGGDCVRLILDTD